MKDAQIIKAFECLLDKMRAYECEHVSIGKGLIMDTLDLIKRLQEQNAALIAGQETLQKCIAEKDKEIERLTVTMNAFGRGMQIEAEKVKSAKSEAVKKFCDNVFERVAIYKFEDKPEEYEDGFMDAVNWYNGIVDSTLLEMVGESDV